MIEEIRSVVQYLILEGLEVSVQSVQRVLQDKGIVAQDGQVSTVIDEEGGPLPAYVVGSK